MLSKEVFKNKMQDLIDFYPSWGIRYEDKTVMAKWYSKFSKLTDEEFQTAANKHIDTIQFNPTVASLMTLINNSSTGGLKIYE